MDDLRLDELQRGERVRSAHDAFAAEMQRIFCDESVGWQAALRAATDLMIRTLRQHGYDAGCDTFEGFKRD